MLPLPLPLPSLHSFLLAPLFTVNNADCVLRPCVRTRVFVCKCKCVCVCVLADSAEWKFTSLLVRSTIIWGTVAVWNGRVFSGPHNVFFFIRKIVLELDGEFIWNKRCWVWRFCGTLCSCVAENNFYFLNDSAWTVHAEPAISGIQLLMETQIDRDNFLYVDIGITASKHREKRTRKSHQQTIEAKKKQKIYWTICSLKTLHVNSEPSENELKIKSKLTLHSSWFSRHWIMD